MLKKVLKSDSLAIGLAMFSMFFGAGNIIFPLAVGQFAQDKNLFAILGLILTAAIMPIAGVIAMILFDGNYKHFFGRLGRAPGFLLALVIISLLGPLGSTPRCIALSYTTIKSFAGNLSPVLFSALSCLIILLFTFKRTHILTLLGWVLTPILLLSLSAIIIIGLLSPSYPSSVEISNFSIFLHGLKEGYNTMDLLAAFFFSSSILALLRVRRVEQGKHYIRSAYKASLVGAFLLSIIYIGFSYLASVHATHLQGMPQDELLAAITMRIAGPYSGMLVCITISIACLTTAIALITAFTDFFQKEVFKEKISYEAVLIGSILLTFFVSTFEFSGISSFLGPILKICYPGLIVLTFLNIAHRTLGTKIIKIPVFATFAISALAYVWV